MPLSKTMQRVLRGVDQTTFALERLEGVLGMIRRATDDGSVARAIEAAESELGEVRRHLSEIHIEPEEPPPIAAPIAPAGGMVH